MSDPSSWSLSKGAKRVVLPAKTKQELENNALSCDCFPGSLGFYPSAYRHEMTRQTHDDYLLMYCVGGEGVLKTEYVEATIHAGDMIVLPPELAHYYAASESKPWSLFWVHFSGAAAPLFIDYLGFSQRMSVAHQVGDASLQAAFYHLLELAQNSRSTQDYILLSNQLRQVLSMVKCAMLRVSKGAPEQQIERVKAFLVENIDQKLSLDDLLSLTSYSKFHFLRLYKDIMGVSPLKHFERLKVEQAKMMLESSSLSVGDIAAQLAFDDPLYFSRVFRKIVGQSPRTYRLSQPYHA